MDLDVTMFTLSVTTMQLAREKYNNFANIHLPVLSLIEFIRAQNLPLNEQCASVFFNRIDHLQDDDFIEIDRPILEMIGFKNNWIEQIDKKGNVKVDENGKPKLKDTRKDFSNAIKCLRNLAGFNESDNFDSNEADYVIKKTGPNPGGPASTHKGGSGQNKQDLWIRKHLLVHLVTMANTCNSRMIREYFFNMNRIMIEYNMYQTIYQAKYELSVKDTTIGSLNNMMVCLTEKTDAQSKQITELLCHAQNTTEKLNTVIDIVRESAQDVVVPADNNTLSELVLIMISEDEMFYTVSCMQKKRRTVTVKNIQRKYGDKNMTVVYEMLMQPNSKNMWHRFKEYVRTHEHLNSVVVLKSSSCVVKDKRIVPSTEISTIFDELKRTYQNRVERRMN